MKRLAGQAGQVLGGVFHGFGSFVFAMFFIVAVGVGGLAFRLSKGPLQIPGVATWLANAVSGADIDIHIGRAALTWAGYQKGGGAPLYLGLGEISVYNTGGDLLAAIPDARLELTPNALLSTKAGIYVASSDARFTGAAVPVAMLAGIHLRGLAFARADLWVTLGAGQIGTLGFAETLTGGKFFLSVTPKDVTLTDAELALAPVGGSAPVIQLSGVAHRDGVWRGTIRLRGNAVQAHDLPAYWPERLVPLTRQWVTRNITDGVGEAADFTFGLQASAQLKDITLENAAGSFQARNVTLIWLPRVRPITQLNGKFTLTDPDDIDIAADRGMLGGIGLAAATLHIAGVAHRDQTGTLHIPVSGSVQDVFAVLNAPPLALLKTVPPQVLAATGAMTGSVDVVVPFKPVVKIGDADLKVKTVLTDVTIPLPIGGLALQQGQLSVDSTTHRLDVAGRLMLAGAPADITVSAGYGPANAGATRFEMKTAITDKTLTALGANPDANVQGSMPLDIRIVTTDPNDGSLQVQADLTDAALKLPMFGWSKPKGKPGLFAFAASIDARNLSGISRIDSIEASAPGLDIHTQAAAGGINLTRVHIGDTVGSGRIVPPANAGSPWRIDVLGNMLDASAAVNPPHPGSSKAPKIAAAKGAKPASPSGFLWQATAHFDHFRLIAKPAARFDDFEFEGSGQGGSVFAGTARAMLGSGEPVDLTISPEPERRPGDAQRLRLQTMDAGGLMRALGSYGGIGGGDLDFNASYGAATPLAGVTVINNFRLLKAPKFAKFLQAITVLGIPAAASGPGLAFTRLVAPFSVDAGVMTLTGGRAYSATLGFTASGTIDLNAGLYDIHGTVVPGYALNALPGKIPVIGKLFSPEKGGGLFAMRYSMTGSSADPKISINPLSALTPGFLRGIFGLGQALGAK